MTEQPDNSDGLSANPSTVISIRPGIGSGAQNPALPGAALPLRASVLAVVTFLAGLIVVGVYAPQLPHSGLAGLVLLTVAATLSDRSGILIYQDSKISIGFIPLFAIAVLYGPPGVVIAAPLAALSLHLPGNVFSYRFLFNVGVAILADSLAAVILFSTIGGQGEVAVSAKLVAVALAAAAANYGVTTFLVSSIAGLATGRSPVMVWQEKFQWYYPHYIVFGLLGLALALAYQDLGLAGLLAFAAPPLMMRFAMKQYVDKTARHVAMLRKKNEQLERANRANLAMTTRLKETYDATLEALAAALDARDTETGGHSSRVTVYTMDMARHLGIEKGSDEWTDIERAALLHDVGKIGISDAILNKAGPLTPEEWQEMRKHPAIGYEMLKDVEFLSNAAQIVYSHHERYDGRGYPEGLKGDAVPLGSRIFAVADAFDAMTSNRPYRRALPVDKAREEIVGNAGSQFDPKVVEAFLLCLPLWEQRLEQKTAA
ncbi:MAG: HD-GYP domain-containing protein [Dehalococcoidia bacterium]